MPNGGIVIDVSIPLYSRMGKRTRSRKSDGSVSNAFTPSEASRISELSVHMLNYLSRHGYLKPHYGGGVRGALRHYSYRDLVVARIASRLLKAGVEISRLKTAIATMAERSDWTRGGDIGLLATDGTQIHHAGPDGSLSDLGDGRLSFAFVLDVRRVRDEVMKEMDETRRANFDLRNRALRLTPNALGRAAS